MRIIFMGTPESAAVCLQSLIEIKEEIVLVVTQPNRPRGRGLRISENPVTRIANAFSLPIQKPEKIKNTVFVSLLKSLKPDLIVVVAYGKIIPREILTIPKHGCINVHASLLPKYRGAAPIQWAILNGENESGITIMQIDETLDTGPIILQTKVKIEDEDSTETLEKKLFEKGKTLLLKAIKYIKDGTVQYQLQIEKDATYAPSLRKEMGIIDWKKSAHEIYNQIRAFDPWPGAYTFYKEKMLKIYRSEMSDVRCPMSDAGMINEIIKNKGFVVATGKGNLLITEAQIEGGKKMGAYEFAIGQRIKAGEALPS